MTAKKADKVALVTGGGQGIGKGIAQRLVEDGMKVVIADIDGEAAGETAAELGSPCTATAVDVADEAAVAGVMQLIFSRFGRLDALINNAGIASPTTVSVEQLELSDWNRIISTNLTGVFLCSKHAVPLLRRSNGTIVNIASTRALQSEAHTEAYSASKGGVTGRLLGARLLCHRGAELINEVALALTMRATVEDLANTVHVYPSIGEGLRLCAQGFSRDMSRLSCCAE